jgi:hypothetical protein
MKIIAAISRQIRDSQVQTEANGIQMESGSLQMPTNDI